MSDPAPPTPSVPAGPPPATTPAATRHCSECGWGTPSHKPHAPLWPKLVLWILPFLATVALVITATKSVTTMTGGPVHLGVALVDPIVSRADLRLIASGEDVVRGGKPIDLSTTFLREFKPSSLGFGEVRYQAMLAASPPGRERHSRSFGYPFSWLTFSTAYHYSDAANRTGPLLATSNPPAGTTARAELGKVRVRGAGSTLSSRTIIWHLAPERTAGKEVDIQIAFAPLVACLSLAIGTACAVNAFVRAMLCNRHKKNPQKPGRFRIGFALVFTLVGTTLFLYPRSTSHLWPYIPRTSSPARIIGIHTSLDRNAALTTLSADDLRGIPDTRLANQRLAADILNVCADEPTAADDDLLFAAACIENWNASCRFLEVTSFLSIFYVAHIDHERCPDFGPQEPVTTPKTLSVRMDLHSVTLTRASGRPNDPMIEFAIFNHGLIAALTLILAPGLIPFFLHRRFTRRRGANRERKNLCPSCAYPIHAPTSTSTSA